MADPNPATEATAIQSTAPEQPPSTAITDAPAPSPPPSEPAPPALVPVRLHNFDRTLVGLVLLLAFFLGSFAIQNSDLWLHLAVGRAVAQGNYPFGADPFSYTSEGVYWANHSWLFDWLLYVLYQLTGGTGLAVFRGLLCLALAAVLLSIRRPGQSLFLPACCTALALLGVSMRFHLNSLLVSYLFLALTLFLLHRAVYLGATFSCRGRSFSPLWLLPPLFALWVNLDGWFLLGPLVVALFLIGSIIQRFVQKTDGARPATLGLVLLAGLAACLLNPYFHRAFVLPLDLAHFLGNSVPPSLAPGAAAARHAADVAPRLFRTISPFEEVYWGQPGIGQNVAGLSYFVLLFLGAGSWVMRGLSLSGADKDDEGNPVARYPTELFLTWLLFAVVSAWNTRFIGLYAVVAGPVCALNLQAVAGRLLGVVVAEVTPPQRNALLAIRLGPIAVCLLLLFLAWPGWLHAAPDDARYSHRVRWEVQVDPQLPHAGARLNELLGTGKLHRGFNLAPEQSYYWAWFVGPTAKTFFDARFAPFPQATATFFQVRKALREDTQAFFTRPPRIVSLPEVLKTLRLVDISYALLTVTDRQMRNESMTFFSGKKASKEPPRLAVLHKVFRDHDVNYLVLSGMHQDDEQLRIAARLLADPREWVLLYADGRTAIFGWRDPEKRDNPFAGLRLDFNRLAFGTAPAADSGQPGRRAPEKTPDPPDGPPGFWSHYLFGQAPSPPSLAEARFYLLMYQLVGPSWQRWHDVYFEMQTRCAWLGPLGAAGTLPAMVSGSVAVSLPRFREVREPIVAEVGMPMESLPLLALRAARRGVAENPADADTYLILADSYRMARQIEDQRSSWNVPVDQLPSLLARPAVRHIQHVMSITQALALNPHYPQVQEILAAILAEIGYFDAALEHIKQAQQTHAAQRPRSEAEQERGKLVAKHLDAFAQALGREVKRRQEEYRLHAAGQKHSVLGKVKEAMLQPIKGRNQVTNREEEVPRNLVLEALKLLREADMSTLPEEERAQVAIFQLRLLLLLGMGKLAREQFVPEVRDNIAALGNQLLAKGGREPREQGARQRLGQMLRNAYEADEAVLAAALGRYDQFEQIRSAREKPIPVAEVKKQVEQANRVLTVSRGLLPLWPLPAVPLAPAVQVVPRAGGFIFFGEIVGSGIGQANLVLAEVAELRALRGLVALERGDTDAAAQHFQAALKISGRINFPSRTIVEVYNSWLKRYR